MPVDTCPSDADWGRWSGGLLVDHLSAEFDSHLVECESCLDRVRNAPAPDRLVLSLKALGPDEELSPGERFSIARIVEKIKLRRGESSVFDPQTGMLPKSDETLRGDAATSAVGRVEGGAAQGDRAESVATAGGSVELEPVSRVEAGPRGAPPHPTMRDNQLATPTDAELQPGLVLGAYKLVRKLGQGGMGMVFLAEHQRMKRLVALKVLPPTVTRNHTAVQRFQREVQAMARLSHPNIVTAHDADEARGLHFLVMEYVDGQDLSDLVKKRGPLSVAQAVDYIVQAARGLEYAHKRGLVHRDIKPSNLLVDTEGHVKVLDLGLARFSDQADSEGMDLTGTGVVAGTVDYMSPEQATNTKTADARADIYSLGCTLWFLLTGKSVYSGETVVARLMAHQTSPIPSLRTLNPSIPEELDRVYQKMIAKQTEQRYQTATELLADLLKLAPSSGGVATPRFAPDTPRPMVAEQTIAGPLSSLSAAGSTVGSTIGEVTAGQGSPPRRGSLVKLAAAAAFALALLFGVWIVLKDKDGKELARIEVKPGNAVTLTPAPGTSVTVENTGERAGTGGTPPATGGRLTSSATKPTPPVAEDVSLPPHGNTPPPIPLDLTPPQPLGTWTAGTPAAWLTGDYSHDGPVMGGLIDTPRAILGVKRWNVDTTWTRAGINEVRFSPDGKWVALACGDGHVRILDASTMKLDRLLPGVGAQGQDVSLDWHPDSQQLAVCGAGLVRILGRDGQSVRAFPLSPDFTPLSVVWNHAGTRLAFGRHFAEVAVEIRAADGTLVSQVTSDPTGVQLGIVRGLCWTADDRQLVVRGSGSRCVEFEAESGREVWGVEDLQPSHIPALSLSRDGWLAVGDGANARLYDDQRKLARTVPSVPHCEVAWHPDGKRLMTAEGLFDRDTGNRTGGRIESSIFFHWSPDGQRCLGAGGAMLAEFTRTGEASGRTWGGHQSVSPIHHPGWSPDGSRLVGQAFVHRVGERSPVLVDTDGHVLTVTPPLVANAWALGTPDGTTTFAFGRARSATHSPPALWGIAQDGTARSLWTLTGESDPQWLIKWSTGGVSPDGRYIALGLPGAVQVLDAAGAAVARIPAIDNGHPTVAWNPATGELSILQDNQPLRFANPKKNWQVRTVGDKLRVDLACRQHWSPDGRWLSNLGFGLYDIEGRPAPNGPDATNVATWRADSAEYVGAGGSQTFFQIRSADGGTVRRTRFTNGDLVCAAWQPRGHLIATGSGNSVITAWRTSDLLPHWTMVLLPDDRSATFSGAGELLHADPAQFDDLLTYTVERDDGSVQNLTPSQFHKFVREQDVGVPK